MLTFQEMNLPPALLKNLGAIKFDQPTPVQQQAIPVAISGRDIIGSAQTGTGKTGAFLIPLLVRLLEPANQSTALVIAPTRELAQQVHEQVRLMLGPSIYLPTALLIGGDSYVKQNRQLEKSARIIIGTPGRINDHLQRKSLELSRCDFLVLDETDRMLDMGFSVQIDRILSVMPSKRQTLLFSATFPEKIRKISNKYLQNPEQIRIDRDSMPAKSIQQETFELDDASKYPKLIEELSSRQGSVIIFMKTKFSTERMANRLSKDGFSGDAIHGDLRQSRRTRVIEGFRKGKFRVLVATDVAARGLDIPHIEHVVNYDLPQCPEDYIHRIGRTARAGASGHAINFVSPPDRSKWNDISELLNPGSGKKSSQSRSSSRGGYKKSSARGQSRSGSDDRKSRFSGNGNSSQREDRRPRFGGNGNSSQGDDRRSRYAGNSNSSQGDDRRSRYAGNSNSSQGDDRRSRYAGNSNSSQGEGRRPRYGGNGYASQEDHRKSRFGGNISSSQGEGKRPRFAGNGHSSQSDDRKSRFAGNGHSSQSDDRKSRFAGNGHSSQGESRRPRFGGNTRSSQGEGKSPRYGGNGYASQGEGRRPRFGGNGNSSQREDRKGHYGNSDRGGYGNSSRSSHEDGRQKPWKRNEQSSSNFNARSNKGKKSFGDKDTQRFSDSRKRWDNKSPRSDRSFDKKDFKSKKSTTSSAFHKIPAKEKTLID